MTRLTLLMLCGLCVLAASLAACGGGGSNVVYQPGPLVCDTFSKASFRYKVHAEQKVDPVVGTPVPDKPVLGAYTLTEDILGNVQDGTKFDASTTTTGSGLTPHTSEVIKLSDTLGYFNNGSGWSAVNATAARPLPLRYQPQILCEALAPDADTSKFSGGQTEDVNGVNSHRYSFSGLSAQFLARESDFGGGSQIANAIQTLDGTVWVADKGYPTKFELSGAGPLSSGQLNSLNLTFEVTDMGADVSVQAPAQTVAP
jgi:hypothetical protein